MDVHRPYKCNVAAVGRPNDGLEVISRLTKNFAGLLAVGLHLPDFLAAVFPTKEDDLSAIRRDCAVFAIIGEFDRRATEDRSVPQAGFLRWRRGARYKNMTTIWEPVHV